MACLSASVELRKRSRLPITRRRAWLKLLDQDQREREYFAEHIEAGLAFVNGMVASHPRAPFGGIKQSGYGRELSVQGFANL